MSRNSFSQTWNASVIAAIWCAAATVLAAPAEYPLSSFGPVKTAVEAEATMSSAITNVIAKGGGLIIIGPDVARDWTAHNNAPSSTRPGANSVTVIDRRDGYERTYVPSNGKIAGSAWTGRQLTRFVQQPIDMALGVHSTKAIDTVIAGGTMSYDQAALREAKAGKDARVYIPTLRGLAVGSHIIISGVPMNYAEPYDRGPIKALGWDRETGEAFLVMDLKHDHPRGAIVYDKHVVNSLTLTDHSQSDNQSMGLMVVRKNYSVGDSFTIASQSCTMGNVMSGAGDEGGLTYAADIYNDLRPFRSRVESIHWDKHELVYAPGPCRNHTLGTSRPIINLNTNKWITRGVAYFVGAGHQDPWHPDQVLVNVGGVFGSRECGWTQDIVGRFFAFDESTEYLDPSQDAAAGYTAAPDMRVYRWYQISKVEQHADGIQRIYLERTRWWVHHQSPSLYNTDNWSYAPRAGKEQLKPLRYIIAPGAYVADVSRAWTDSAASDGFVNAGSPRALSLAPTPDVGTRFDFEKGDPIVQAIGPDPWNVVGMRVRHFNYMPSTLPDASYQAANWGRVAVDSAFSMTGGTGNLDDDAATMKTKSVRYARGVDLFVTTDVGIRFGADTKDAAIRFEQPHDRTQPMVWYANGRPAAFFTVDATSGEFTIRSASTHVASLSVAKGCGISGSRIPARNFRGLGLAVRKGSTDWQVRFDAAEPDVMYAACVQPNWPTASAVVQKGTDGFTVRFEKPAPRGAKLDWVLVR